MSKKLLQNLGAEREANEVASRFMDSTDVVGDMSRAFGHDFSQVNIHTDESAAQRVEGTGADAFAQGNDIFFGRGIFQKDDPASRGLLAHELTHTMQQSGGEGVHESAPQGEMQGGLIDWFRKKFGKKKQPMNISAPLSVQADTSPEAVAYQKAMRGATMDASSIPNRLEQAQPGQLGGADAFQNLRDVFAANDTIAASNTMLATGGGKANALANLHLRTSETQEAKANKAYQGDLLSGFYNNVPQYFHNLENGGMDLRYAMNGTQKDTIVGSPGAFNYGGKIDQIQDDLLTMLAPYLTSDQGIEYFQNMTNLVQGADVFEGNQSAALDYMMRTILTSAGGAFTRVGAQKDTYEHGAEATKAAQEAMRTLLFLPTLSAQSTEYKQALTPEMRSLVDKYEALIQEIQQKMAQRA